MAGHAACIKCHEHACGSGVVQHARIDVLLRSACTLVGACWHAHPATKQRATAIAPDRAIGSSWRVAGEVHDGLERTAAYLCAPSSALHCKGTAAPAPVAAHDKTLTRRRGVAPLSVALCYHRRSLTVVCVQLLSLQACATPWQRCLQINPLPGAVLCFRR